MKIAPSILTCNFYNLEKDLKEVLEFTDILHLDIMDGVFVPNISFGLPIVKSIRENTSFILDTHLMITNPEKYIEDFIKNGSDIITVHYEATNKLEEIIKKIHKFNKKVGVSIKPNTDINLLNKYLNLVDLVLVMSVEPGFGGQKFMAQSIDKVNYLDNYRKEHNLNYLIEIDGGINNETIKLVNVDIAVVGSYLMNSSSKLEKYKLLIHK